VHQLHGAGTEIARIVSLGSLTRRLGAAAMCGSECRRSCFPSAETGIIHPMDVDLSMGTPDHGVPLAVPPPICHTSIFDNKGLMAGVYLSIFDNKGLMAWVYLHI